MKKFNFTGVVIGLLFYSLGGGGGGGGVIPILSLIREEFNVRFSINIFVFSYTARNICDG